MVYRPELGGYQPGQAFYSDADLERIRQQQISPALTKFDKKTGHTVILVPSKEQKGIRDK